MIDLTTLIGMMGVFFGSALFFPQIIRALKTKHTKDISIGTYLILLIYASLWLTYSISIGNILIALQSTFTLIFTTFIILLKRKYDRNG